MSLPLQVELRVLMFPSGADKLSQPLLAPVFSQHLAKFPSDDIDYRSYRDPIQDEPFTLIVHSEEWVVGSCP